MVQHTISVPLEVLNEGVALAAKVRSDPELALIVKASRARSGMIEMKFCRFWKAAFTLLSPLQLVKHGHGCE